MMYATPKTVVTALASRGSSGTRAEALRLLASELPDDWPECPRRSRLSLLRRLACDKKKSAKARLAALQEVLKPQAAEALPAPAPSTVERLSMGSSATSSDISSPASITGPNADTQKELSTAILRAAGKTHLSELGQQEWARHLVVFSWQERLELDRQRGEWVAPDDGILGAMGMSRLTYWQGVRDRAKTDDVRQNATKEISKLEGDRGH